MELVQVLPFEFIRGISGAGLDLLARAPNLAGLILE